MDDNTKNILYPKGSIFRILKDDIISAKFKIVKGAIAEAVSDIEVNDKYAEVCCNGETFVIETDIMDIFDAINTGTLAQLDIRWSDKACACVILASGGYPKSYPKGLEITGLTDGQRAGVTVYHAGTAQKEGKLVTAGGRVLGITALGDDLQAALDTAYAAAREVHFDGVHYRKDIGARALAAGKCE